MIQTLAFWIVSLEDIKIVCIHMVIKSSVRNNITEYILAMFKNIIWK